jgi:hypothetical protein
MRVTQTASDVVDEPSATATNVHRIYCYYNGHSSLYDSGRQRTLPPHILLRRNQQLQQPQQQQQAPLSSSSSPSPATATTTAISSVAVTVSKL